MKLRIFITFNNEVHLIPFYEKYNAIAFPRWKWRISLYWLFISLNIGIRI